MEGVDGEAEFLTEAAEVGDVGFGVVAEAEGFAFVDFYGVECVGQDRLGEVVGGPEAEVGVEGKDEDEVEAGGGEEGQLFGEWGDEGKAWAVVKDVGGVGVEGDGGGADRFPGCGAEFFGAGDDRGDDGAVAAVDAVEVADGDDGGAGEGFEFSEGAGYLQSFRIQGSDVG